MKIFRLAFIFLIIALMNTSLSTQSDARSSRATVEAEKKDKPYLIPSPSSLSRLYWALGKFEIMDDNAVDDFIRLNDCRLFMKYYFDEFEWDRIREATRNYIRTNLSQFPTRFQFVRPLELDRYNFEEGFFEVHSDFIANEVKKIDFNSSGGFFESSLNECTDGEILHTYPPGIIMEASRPFTLTQVPVEKELARLFVEQTQKRFSGMKFRTKQKDYKREVFMKVKVEFSQFKEVVEEGGKTGGFKALVFGRIDSIEIFSDPHLKKPLFYKNMVQKRTRRIAKNRAEELNEAEN